MLTPIRTRINTLHHRHTQVQMLTDEFSSSDIRSESENLVLPSGNHEFLLTGCFPYLRVDVHCKERASAVEDRGE